MQGGTLSDTQDATVSSAPISDWIDTFMAYTEGVSSPRLFRLWSAITCIGGAMERRCWVKTTKNALFPNMYVALVASPGVGKGESIKHVEDLWYAAKRLGGVPCFKVGGDDVTRASLIDAVSESAVKRLINGTELIEYSTLLLPAEELGVLISAHDLSFLAILTKLWNSPKNHIDKKRHLKKEISIINPQLTILAGTQPDFLASLLPEEAWGQGFMARVIMIYASTPVRVPLFDGEDMNHALRQELISGLVTISDMYGKFTWTQEAMILLDGWDKDGRQPIPEHSKLTNYNARRTLHVIKLSMISAMSRTRALAIEHQDVRRALDWLLEAEILMPDIFREMAAKSDNQVIQDLHFYLWRLWIKDGKKPIHEARIVNFLKAKVPSEKIFRVMEVAERSGVIARMAGTEKLYTPRPRSEHGLE